MGQREIQTLQDRLALSDSLVASEVAQEVTKLALQYGLVTDYSSFVLVDRHQQVSLDGTSRTVIVPVELPSQWVEVEGTMKDISAQDFGPMDFEDEQDQPDLDQLRQMAEESPIRRVVDLILSQAINERADRLVLRPEAKYIAVEFEVGGLLCEVMTPPRHTYAAIV